MWFITAALLLCGSLSAWAAPNATHPDLTVTSGSTTLYFSLSTNMDNGPASQSVATIPVSAPLATFGSSISGIPTNPRPTNDVPNLPHGIPFSETANQATVITSKSASASGGSAGASTTITGKSPDTTDWSALGCTQFATVSGTLSPLCVLQQTTDETSVWASQTGGSSGATNATPVPSAPFGNSSSVQAVSTNPIPITPTEEPHEPLPTSSKVSHSSSHHSTSSTRVPTTTTQPILPPPPSWTEVPNPLPSTIFLNSSTTGHSKSLHSTSSEGIPTTTSQPILPPPPSWTEVPNPLPSTIWLNSSTTFKTSTRPASPIIPVQDTTSLVKSVTKPGLSSLSHSHDKSSSHGPQSAGGYTMTKNVTETIHSTTTIPGSRPQPKQTVVTTVVLTTLVSTVTADKPTSSACVDKTITSTRTVIKHVSKPQEPSQSLVMLSQLPDGQINGPPVTLPTVFTSPHHGPQDPSSLSFLASLTAATASPSAILDPLQSMSIPNHPQPSMGFPHHGHGNGTTTKPRHDGTETRNPDAPVPFPTQSFFNITSLLEHSSGPKPGHQPTLSV